MDFRLLFRSAAVQVTRRLLALGKNRKARLHLPSLRLIADDITSTRNKDLT